MVVYDESMAEQEPPRGKPIPPQFGDKLPGADKRGAQTLAASMFDDGSDLPIFSGTPVPAVEKPFVPQDYSYKQQMLIGMPPVDFDQLFARGLAQAQGQPAGGQAN